MEVICLQDEVIKRFTAQSKNTNDKWISGEEAMKMLRITSKTTLQKLRDEGKVRFSQPERKIILYDVDSIFAYLNKNARATF